MSCCIALHDGAVTSDLSRNAEFDEFDTQFCPATGTGVVAFIPRVQLASLSIIPRYVHSTSLNLVIDSQSYETINVAFNVARSANL